MSTFNHCTEVPKHWCTTLKDSIDHVQALPWAWYALNSPALLNTRSLEDFPEFLSPTISGADVENERSARSSCSPSFNAAVDSIVEPKTAGKASHYTLKVNS